MACSISFQRTTQHPLSTYPLLLSEICAYSAVVEVNLGFEPRFHDYKSRVLTSWTNRPYVAGVRIELTYLRLMRPRANQHAPHNKVKPRKPRSLCLQFTRLLLLLSEVRLLLLWFCSDDETRTRSLDGISILRWPLRHITIYYLLSISITIHVMRWLYQ